MSKFKNDLDELSSSFFKKRIIYITYASCGFWLFLATKHEASSQSFGITLMTIWCLWDERVEIKILFPALCSVKSSSPKKEKKRRRDREKNKRSAFRKSISKKISRKSFLFFFFFFIFMGNHNKILIMHSDIQCFPHIFKK